MSDLDNSSEGTNKATAGYNAAVSMLVYEGGLIWNKYNAMLVANSIVLALIGAGFASADSKAPLILDLSLSVVGISLCAVWYLMTKRGFDYHRYWVRSASELEAKHLAPTVVTFQRGASFSSGARVPVEIDGKREFERLRFESRILRAETLAYVPILVFAMVYVLTLVLFLRH